MMEQGIINDSALPINIRKKSYSRNIKSDKIKTLKETEQEEIQRAIEYFGNTTEGKIEAANALGIGIATLYRKLQ